MTDKNPPLLFLDTETSGLDPRRHGILQIAWILEMDDKVLAEKVMDIQLPPNTDLCMAALDCNGFTLARTIQGKTLSYMFAALKSDLSLAVKSDLLVRPVGHNVQFDLDFLKAASDQCRENIQFSLDFKKSLDTLAVLRWMDYRGAIHLKDYKLETVAQNFAIPLKAHDALEDVRATRAVFHLLKP